MNTLINSIANKYDIPSFDTQTLLKSFNNFIKNFEFENSEQTDPLLRNLKETQQAIFKTHMQEKAKLKLKKDEQGRWCRVNQDQKLEPIKFKISGKSRHKATGIWKELYQELVKFKEKHGHTNATSSRDGKLGNWVASQRCRLRNSTITEEQFEKLNEIGFEWDRTSFFYLPAEEKAKSKKEPSN